MAVLVFVGCTDQVFRGLVVGCCDATFQVSVSLHLVVSNEVTRPCDFVAAVRQVCARMGVEGCVVQVEPESALPTKCVAAAQQHDVRRS